MRVLQRRPSNRIDRWQAGRYLRALPAPGGLSVVSVTNRGTIDAPDLRVDTLGGEHIARASLEAVLRRILGLDVDPGALERLAEAEPRLRPTASALRGMRPPRYPGLFEAFANVVPFQQVSLDAGVAVVGRLVERFGPTVEHEGRHLHGFPSAEVVAEADPAALRACGLSVRKAATLQLVAASIATGDLTEDAMERMSSEDALRSLTELPGIGPWSAALVLLRGLGRLDVFPPGDVGARRGLGALLRPGPTTTLDRTIRRLGDRRGYLYFCSLGSDLVARGLIDPAPVLLRADRRAR